MMKKLPNRLSVESLSENNRKRQDLSTVFHDQDE